MKQFIGTVVGKKMKKTAVVKVDTFTQHPVYKKRVKRSKKYLVHDEKKVSVGDRVVFMETRPVSKLKKWEIVGIEGEKK